MASILTEVTDETFRSEVTEYKGVVVVDYYAEWCMPCKMMHPVIEELNKEYAGAIKFVKGDIENNNNSVSEFIVKGVPSILIFKGGELLKQSCGLCSKKTIQEDIEEVRNA